MLAFTPPFSSSQGSSSSSNGPGLSHRVLLGLRTFSGSAALSLFASRLAPAAREAFRTRADQLRIRHSEVADWLAGALVVAALVAPAVADAVAEALCSAAAACLRWWRRGRGAGRGRRGRRRGEKKRRS